MVNLDRPRSDEVTQGHIKTMVNRLLVETPYVSLSNSKSMTISHQIDQIIIFILLHKSKQFVCFNVFTISQYIFCATFD